jgi:hypothetical protein
MFGAEWGYGEGLARRADVVNLSNGRNFRVRSIPTKSSARSKVGFEGQSGSDSSLPTPPVLTSTDIRSASAEFREPFWSCQSFPMRRAALACFSP